MSHILSAELSAACSALGSFDPKTNNYYGDDNTLETVKDLIRYLRRDTETHEIRRYFGAAKILQINLIPLLKLYWQQTDLFDVLLRLLGNLTSPVLLLYNEEIPKEKTMRNQFLQILGHLQSYKEAFADHDLWAVLCTRLSQLLEIEWHERGEENSLIIERILILVRNVLSVPADRDTEKRPDNDVSAHDKVLWSLRKSGLVDIILYMVSSDQEESYYMYLLEILSLMLRDHRPVDLADAAITRTESEKAQDEAEFLSVRKQEMARKNERLRTYTSARHSRFGGTFIFKNVKSVNDEQELIYHKTLGQANSVDFDTDKTRVRKPKNRQPLHEETSFRRSTFSIRLLLKDFCIEFLNAGYNKLMRNVRGKLARGVSATHDETYYLWALKFFMEFNRHHKFDMKLVSETMSIQIFHFVQQQMEHNFDMIRSDKTMWPLWSKRLHIALQAYKELLFTLCLMEKSNDEAVRNSAKIIRNNVFYVLEYREFVLTLLLTYNALRMSDAYLIDLIETQHIFLKMMHEFCGKSSSVVVQKRQRIRKKKKQQQPVATVVPEENIELKWDEIGPQISAVLDGGENIPIIVPFDATKEVPIDEQKSDALANIQNYLRNHEIENAIGLLRASRDVWPENDLFGVNDGTPEQEFLVLREIYFAEIQGSKSSRQVPAQAVVEEDESEEDEEDDSADEQIEVDFKFDDFIKRFAHPKIVQACALALRHFDTNPVNINHYVIKLLHRISWDCRMSAMLFQASIFRTFQRIFAEKHRAQYKELVKFATYIVRQFVKVSEKNKHVFMEMLFWKNCAEAYDLEEGYGAYKEQSKASKRAWTEQEEDELRVLVTEYKEKEIEQEAIDWIMNNMIDNTKSRRMIIKKLKEMMLMNSLDNKKAHSSRPPKEWNENEIMQLTELYNQFKDATDPLGCIVDRLTTKRAKNRVRDKILELNLATDKKALYKKHALKSQRSQGNESHSENESIDSLSDDDNSSKEDENKSISSSAAKTQQNISRKKTSHSTRPKVRKSHKMDFSITRQLILDLIKKGLSSSLEWICESLTDAAEDLEQDSDNIEDVPLVPIAESDLLAMDDSLFKKMLLSIGIKKPADEQEIYWRIPGNKTLNELLQLKNFINDLLNAPEEATNNPEETQKSTNANESSDDEDVFEKLRDYISKEREKIVEEEETNEAEIQEQQANDSDAVSDASNKENEQQYINLNSDSINKTKNQTKKKRIQVLDESDDEERNCDLIETNTMDSDVLKEKRNASDNETDKENTSKRGRDDSDTELNSKTTKRKRIAVIESDDDE